MQLIAIEDRKTQKGSRVFEVSAGLANMGDSNEELEPLFDYSRVQPVNFVDLEDDSDSSLPNTPKRRKISKTGLNNKGENNDEKGKSVEVIDCEEEEEKENWLPPPPKNVGVHPKLDEDSTIKQLRLKRQELASVVQSTEHALRAVDEATRKKFTPSSHSATEETAEKVLPTVERTKIVISIQDKDGSKQYRVFADDKFELLFKKYAQKANIDIRNLVFSFDGDKVSPAMTPQNLGMEDDDLIEVHVKAS